MPSSSIMAIDAKTDWIKKRLLTTMSFDDIDSEINNIKAGTSPTSPKSLDLKATERYTFERQLLLEQIKKENLIQMEQSEHRGAFIDEINKNVAALDKRYHTIKNMLYVMNK